MYTSAQLVEILRETLRRVEQIADISPDDPALIALKRVVLLRIAAIEIEGAEESPAAATEIFPDSPAESN